MIRKAVVTDIDRVAEIYEAIHTECEAGRCAVGWKRNIYPIRQDAAEAQARDELYVMEQEGRIVSAAIINQKQVPEYVNCQWQYPARDEEVLVLHTLVVDPACQGRGYAKAFVRFYEASALERGCPYLRMDTQAQNTIARSLYKGLGFQEPGIVDCCFNGIPGVRLVCLEKLLPGPEPTITPVLRATDPTDGPQ